MGKDNYILILLFFIASCNVKQNNIEFTDKLFENEILQYINKYNIQKTCDIHILLINFKHNYKAFNISTSTSKDYGLPINRIILNGYNVLLYSGWEDYVMVNDKLLQVDTSLICNDAGQQLTVDSAGVIKTYYNIGIVHQCELPDIKHLLEMAKK